MATPNYSYEKRQRELAKKRKKEDKAARKSQGGSSESAAEPDSRAPEGNTTAGGTQGNGPTTAG